MSFMMIANMSIMAVPLIAIVILVRFLTVYRLPKKTFYVMWGIVLAQLLVPCNLFAWFDVSDSIAKVTKNISIDTFAGDMLGIIDTMSTANANIVTAAAETTANQLNFNISPILLIWLMGLVCLSVYFIVTHMKFRKMYNEALPIDSTFIRAWKVEYSDSLRRKVRISQSDMIVSPLTYGIVKPVILLPCNIDYSDETTLRYILYHEYTHIRRFDTLSKLVFTVALCIHWFNPFVWVMYILANRDIELSCDENVVRNITSGANARADYANTLITLAEKKSLPVLGVNFSRNVMRERIKSIMKTPKSSVMRIIFSFMLVSVVIMVCASMQSGKDSVDGYSAELIQVAEKSGVITLDQQNEQIPELQGISGTYMQYILYVSSVAEYAELVKNPEKMYNLQCLVMDGNGNLIPSSMALVFEVDIFADDRNNEIVAQLLEYLLETRTKRAGEGQPDYYAIRLSEA